MTNVITLLYISQWCAGGVNYRRDVQIWKCDIFQKRWNLSNIFWKLYVINFHFWGFCIQTCHTKHLTISHHNSTCVALL